MMQSGVQLTRKELFFRTIKAREKDIKSFGVIKIGIFGSVARGEDTNTSDLDVLVQFKKGEKNYHNFLGVVDLLENELGQEVELVTVESLSPYIGPYILKEVQYAPIAS
jgi:predicted nucleotidyltransferase